MNFRSAVCVCVVLATPAIANDEPANNIGPARIAQAQLDALQEVSQVPGFSAAVWHGGTVVWTGTAGMRDLEQGLPVTADTRFRLASVSKLVTAVAAGKLAEEGKLDLDAPITTVLPWLDNDWPPITSRHLAAHTAGLPHYQPVDAARGAVHYPSSQAAVDLFRERSLLFQPGAEYSYSSWGYTLLGALIEEVTGQPFAGYLASDITPGLDLGVEATDSDDPRVTRAYAFVDGMARIAPAHDFSYTVGGGGLMASAGGLVRFGGAMLEDRIVSRSTFDDMLKPFVLETGQIAGEQGFEVGFGWRTASDTDGHQMAFHNGITLGARSALVLWRGEGTAASILSNAMWTSSIDSTAQMLAAPFRGKPPGLVPATCPVDAKRFEGTFAGTSVSGFARFEVVDGICHGTLELSGDLRAYFDRGPQPTSAILRIVGLDAGGGLDRGGLITPFGIYDLRATAGEGYRSELSSTRLLDFRFLNSTGTR